MREYFRVVGYCEEKDFCFVLDSYGYCNEIWELSADLIRRKYRVPIAATQGNMLDGNIPKIPYDDKAVHLRAVAIGKPQHTVLELNGVRYKAVQVGDKVFVTDKTAIIY